MTVSVNSQDFTAYYVNTWFESTLDEGLKENFFACFVDVQIPR